MEKLLRGRFASNKHVRSKNKLFTQLSQLRMLCFSSKVGIINDCDNTAKNSNVWIIIAKLKHDATTHKQQTTNNNK
jgi:hypothetical protein